MSEELSKETTILSLLMSYFPPLFLKNEWLIGAEKIPAVRAHTSLISWSFPNGVQPRDGSTRASLEPWKALK